MKKCLSVLTAALLLLMLIDGGHILSINRKLREVHQLDDASTQKLLED